MKDSQKLENTEKKYNNISCLTWIWKSRIAGMAARQHIEQNKAEKLSLSIDVHHAGAKFSTLIFFAMWKLSVVQFQG